ncbi:unnamed protein product [Sphagnum jensenii]|uniref:Uncharacterized protein n=1 Tax=Sphagnum jensenii TaxID=128206 RepID=A0ABP1A3E2_9BRYO
MCLSPPDSRPEHALIYCPGPTFLYKVWGGTRFICKGRFVKLWSSGLSWKTFSSRLRFEQANVKKFQLHNMGKEAERWWSKDTVAVVTGANKGLGFGIVRQLAKEGITVVLTARDATRGNVALESLKSQGLHNVNFHPLDVASQVSILALAEWLHKTYGGIDILINNAGIANPDNDVTFETVKPVLDTNYFGVKNVTKALLPLLRDDTPGGARVIVVASILGQLEHLVNKDYVKTLSDREHITEDFVDSFVNHYLKDVVDGSEKEGGCPNWTDWVNSPFGRPLESYSVSKVAVIAYVSALHNTIVAQPGSGKKINVFSCCPGFVATDINNNMGTKTVEEGADTPVWLALHSPEEGIGKFWTERKVVDF